MASTAGDLHGHPAHSGRDSSGVLRAFGSSAFLLAAGFVRLFVDCNADSSTPRSPTYFAHPESRYFGVRRIGRDQLEDYAARKAIPIEEAARWLAPILAD